MKLIPDSDPILHTKAAPVEDLQVVRDSVEEMFQLMHEHHGLGLAAPQVGISQRFFVMEYGGVKTVCINPEILGVSQDTCVFPEGCLSYPGHRLDLTRPAEVKLAYTDLNGVRKSPTFRGTKARVVLHECDHLDGIVFTDRLDGTA